MPQQSTLWRQLQANNSSSNGMKNLKTLPEILGFIGDLIKILIKKSFKIISGSMFM